MIRLVIAPLNYSSWSVRAWLALDHAGADFKTHEIALFVDPDWREKILVPERSERNADELPRQGERLLA